MRLRTKKLRNRYFIIKLLLCSSVKSHTDNVKRQGLEHTTKYSATPGFSEHQTGLAIDVSADSVNNRLDESFGDSTEGKWLAENAHLYGFIIRYPKDKTKITGYSYEPWHIRYVGKPLAKYIYENNLCLEEYYNFKPSMDYSDQISYDKLVDYGIDLADVLEPTKAPTKAPTNKPEKNTEEDKNTKEDKNTEEDKATADDTKDTTEDSVKPTKKPSDGNGNDDTTGETREDNTGDDGNATTKPPKGHETTPSVTLAPTETVTPTPNQEEDITDATTDEETP